MFACNAGAPIELQDIGMVIEDDHFIYLVTDQAIRALRAKTKPEPYLLK